MAFTVYTDGQTQLNTELNYNNSFISSGLIVSLLNLAANSHLTYTPTGFKYDIYTSDSASSKTALYDTTWDAYFPNIGAGYKQNALDWTTTGTGAIEYGDGFTFNMHVTGASRNCTTIGTYNIFTNSNYIESNITMSADGTGASTVIVTLFISDGTNHSQLNQVSDGGPGSSSTDVYRVQKFNSTTLKWWKNGVAQPDIDITGWGASIYFRSTITTGGDAASDGIIYFNYIFECNSSWNYTYLASNVISSTTTITTSVISGIAHLIYVNLMPTISLSFDNGGNYTTITQDMWSSISNVGTTYKLKMEWSAGTFTWTDINNNTLPKIYGFGGFYY